MEGQGLQALGRLVFCFLVISASSVVPLSARSQSAADSSSHDYPLLASSFLEPNRFTVTSDIDRPNLWLEIGYGRGVNVSRGIAVGLEALGWSRLRSLSGFRFPVETADYFFGAFVTYDRDNEHLRLRLSHISSHLVDGTDTAELGGASSRYSREFLELDQDLDLVKWAKIRLGLRYLFHQVTHIEPTLQVPVIMQVGTGSLLGPSWLPDVFVTADVGPVSPNFAAGLQFELPTTGTTVLELRPYYYRGASWAGNDEARRTSGLKVSFGIRDLSY